MDGENNGAQAQQVEQQQEDQTAQQQAEAQQETQGKHAKPQGEGTAASPAGTVDAERFEAQLAERDSRIAELEAQIAEAAKNAETADGLRAEIAALKQQGEDERVEFTLLLVGCRNVKAARAVLDDHGGDVEALKAAEPWMFADAPQKQTGKTGLSNAGEGFDERLEALTHTTVGQLATRDVYSVQVDDDMRDVCAVLASRHLKKAPVMRGDRVVGVINRSNITRHAVERYRSAAD